MMSRKHVVVVQLKILDVSVDSFGDQTITIHNLTTGRTYTETYHEGQWRYDVRIGDTYGTSPRADICEVGQ